MWCHKTENPVPAEASAEVSALTFFPLLLAMVIRLLANAETGSPLALAPLNPMATKSANGAILQDEPLQEVGASAIHSADASGGRVDGVCTVE